MRSSSIWFNHFLIPTSGWKRKNSYSLQPEVDLFGNGEVTASLRYAFHTKNILFSKNCPVAVSGSKVTNDPSKCSQERGLLPYYHNLFVLFVIFEKKWRWFFWQWQGYGFPLICISHKKHTIFKKLSRRRFWVKSYKWPIKMFARKRAFTLLLLNLYVMFVIFEKKWRWFFWQWRGYGFPSICISHKKHTIFKKLSRHRFWGKSYKWPIKMFARKRAFTLLS